MKTQFFPRFSLTILALSLGFWLGLPVLVTKAELSAAPSSGGDTAVASEPTTGKEDLGVDVFNGKTNKIARVYKVDPLSIYVIYESGTAGRKIPRSELPPELMSKYPYDPAKALEFQKQQAAAAQQQAQIEAERAEAGRAVVRQQLRHREQELLAEIENLRKRDVELQKQKKIVGGLPGGHGRKVRSAQINDAQEDIRKRIATLDAQLTQVRSQVDAAR